MKASAVRKMTAGTPLKHRKAMNKIFLLFMAHLTGYVIHCEYEVIAIFTH